jgi:hypothetical protein
MFHLGVCNLGRALFLSLANETVSGAIHRINSITKSAAPCNVHGLWPGFAAPFANLVTRESKCRRITVRP